MPLRKVEKFCLHVCGLAEEALPECYGGVVVETEKFISLLASEVSWYLDFISGLPDKGS